MQNTTRFQIGQKVYHVVGETKAGVIIDICYKFRTGQYEYCVTFDPLTSSMWYFEDELTETPNFV